MSDQYLRKVGLIVSAGTKGLDLSNMRIRFNVYQSDIDTPNNAIIRVYNLSENTAKSVQNEYQEVTLQAGYEGDNNYGVIFVGTIKQVRRGRESPLDTYLDILAADGDIPYNFGVVSKVLAAGSNSPQDQIKVATDAMGLPPGYVPDLPPGALARGKVMFGMARGTLSDVADSTKTTWSIQNGRVNFIPLTSYLPGEVVVLTSTTGMIGLPEQTNDGIHIKALLNPRINVGGLVQIDNASIQRTLLGGDNLYLPGRLEQFQGLLPKVTDDGFYRVYVAEYEGDTRGEEWFVNLTCLAVDRSASIDQSVQAYG